MAGWIRLVCGTCLASASAGTLRASETISYTYDAQGRLTKVEHSGSVNNAVESNYSFDAAANRTNVTVAKANSRVVVVPVNGLTVIPIPDP